MKLNASKRVKPQKSKNEHTLLLLSDVVLGSAGGSFLSHCELKKKKRVMLV